MSQSYSCCSGLGSPHSQKVPQPLGSTEKATGGPEDMPAVPVPVEKVPAAGRGWGCGRGVGERPGLGRRGADPPRVSAPGVNKSVPPRRVPAETPAVAPARNPLRPPPGTPSCRSSVHKPSGRWLSKVMILHSDFSGLSSSLFPLTGRTDPPQPPITGPVSSGLG